MNENDRLLLNYLNHRMGPDGNILPQYKPDKRARKFILRRIALAHVRGLTIEPGVYHPRPAYLRWDEGERCYVPATRPPREPRETMLDVATATAPTRVATPAHASEM